jgi:SAM-dependent methyltransferase
VAAAELRLVFDGLGLAMNAEVERVDEGRARYLGFESNAPVETVAAVVGRLSASAALFELVKADPGPLLRPIPIGDELVYGTDLVTVQRYKGKTNERLTRAMLNIALATAGLSPANPSGVVLDPMCGRGTTLNWALTYGLDAIGIEADGSSLEHHAGFLQTWAKRQRLPHKFQTYRAKNSEQRWATLEVAPDRATLKAGGQRLQTFNADGAEPALPIKRSTVDAIVTDLPYGVQHRNAAGGSDTVELLERVAPVWSRWLRPGGALCLAWNTKRGGRREVSRVLVEAGLSPVTVNGGYSMRHVVDATVDRDVLVALRS